MPGVGTLPRGTKYPLPRMPLLAKRYTGFIQKINTNRKLRDVQALVCMVYCNTIKKLLLAYNVQGFGHRHLLARGWTVGASLHRETPRLCKGALDAMTSGATPTQARFKVFGGRYKNSKPFI